MFCTVNRILTIRLCVYEKQRPSEHESDILLHCNDSHGVNVLTQWIYVSIAPGGISVLLQRVWVSTRIPAEAVIWPVRSAERPSF